MDRFLRERWFGRLDPIEAYTWIAHLNHVDDTGLTWVSARTVADYLGHKFEGHVRSAITALGRLGMLITVKRGGGGRLSMRRVVLPDVASPREEAGGHSTAECHFLPKDTPIWSDKTLHIGADDTLERSACRSEVVAHGTDQINRPNRNGTGGGADGRLECNDRALEWAGIDAPFRSKLASVEGLTPVAIMVERISGKCRDARDPRRWLYRRIERRQFLRSGDLIPPAAVSLLAEKGVLKRIGSFDVVGRVKFNDGSHDPFVTFQDGDGRQHHVKAKDLLVRTVLVSPDQGSFIQLRRACE